MARLTQSLGPLGGAALMLNIVVGAGVLTLPGLAVQAAGGAALYSWGLCALASIPLLLVFIMIGRSHANAGGIAHVADHAFGRLGYAIASFLFLGAVVFGLPAIALAGGHYLALQLPLSPGWLAALLLVLATLSQLASPHFAARLSAVIALCVLLAIVAIIIVGLTGLEIRPALARIPPPSPATLTLAIGPFMMVFFAFTGWEVAAGTSEEFANPSRDVPLAMGLSFGIVVLLYGLMAFIVQSYDLSGAHEAALADILRQRLGSLGGQLMAWLAGLIVLANLMGAIWAVSRMVFSLTREGIVPLPAYVDQKGRPLLAVACVLACLMGVLTLDGLGLLSIAHMLQLAGQNFLLLYGIAALALLKIGTTPMARWIASCALLVTLLLIWGTGTMLLYPLALIAAAALLVLRELTAARTG